MKLIRKTIVEDKQNYWDITIPKNHNFVLENGLVVHNCGTGLGFSVERQYINQLPEIAEEFHKTDTTIVVADSKIGWSTAFRQLISLLYQGLIPKWDVSKVRPAGAKLKTFGGRASGPEPLEELFRFAISLFTGAAGRKLNSIECHDLMCKIADIVVVGGVRRSALISLSNLTDQRMRIAKQGQWWVSEPQRALANNSVAYTEKPDMAIFMDEWKALYMSKCGERGIFNRVAAIKQQPKRRKEFKYTEYGCNPCCLPYDVEIDTDKGKIKIGDIIKEGVEGYTVLTFNTETGETQYEPIIAGEMTRPDADLIELEIECEDGSVEVLRLTPDHRVYTENRGYVEASNLTEEDEIVVIK